MKNYYPHAGTGHYLTGNCVYWSLARLLLATVIVFASINSFAGNGEQQAPNILLIVADDLGYSDIGSYGGEIATPHIDSLAKRGIRFSDFSVAPTCSTTRSMLLTGVDNHLNGLGGLDTTGRPRKEKSPGYEGHLNARVVTVASRLREHGYHTYMAGKWHLGYSLETGPENRGFESVFVLAGGAATHFSDRGLFGDKALRYRENGKQVAIPDDFYSSTFFTDKLIEYIDSQAEDGRPFFAYASYTAPHWPLQAPAEFIEKYRGVYDAGYDVIREQRLENLKSIGLIASRPRHAQTNPMQRDWNSLDVSEKEREIRHMQVYAGMVDALDHNIGRLLDHIEQKGKADNTVVIFISDNGPEGNDPYVITAEASRIREKFKTDTPSLGSPGSFSSYGPGWAGVSATPFSLYKAFPAEGGIRVPAIFVLPGLQQKANSIVHDFASVLDITPTILELAGLDPLASTGQSSSRLPIQGKSLVDYLGGNAPAIRHDAETVGWELLGRKAIRSGNWKMSWIDQPYGPGEWALYNLAADPSESINLAKSETARLQQMLHHWQAYVKHNNVLDYKYTNLQYGNANQHYQR